MTMRATFTIDDDAYAFLTQVGGTNRSDLLMASILKANQEEAENQNYQEELSNLDATLPDGLPSE